MLLVPEINSLAPWHLFQMCQKTGNYSKKGGKDTHSLQNFKHSQTGTKLLCCYTVCLIKLWRCILGFNLMGRKMHRQLSEDIMQKFEEFAVRQVNVTYERSIFTKGVKEEEESFKRFNSAIRGLSKTSSFWVGCADSMIRDRIVLGIRGSSTPTKLLKVRDLTL